MMELLDPVKTVMPPPAGTAGGRQTEFMQPPQHYPVEPLMKKQRVSEEEDTSLAQPNRYMMTAPRNPEEPMAHADPVMLWQDIIDQVQKGVEASGREWLRHWSKLHEEEKAAMARIRDLYKTAQELNTGFHQQLDSLHNTVVGVVSTFKK